MRTLILVILTSLTACQPDYWAIKPDDKKIVELTFNHTGTIAGINHTLLLSDERQLIRRNQCERVISFADWRTMLTSFDQQAFEHLPARSQQECCDQSIYKLVVRTQEKTYAYDLSDYTLTDSVRPFIDKLAQRSWTESARCQ